MQCRVSFSIKEIGSAPGEDQTQDLLIPKRASYHWTTAPIKEVIIVTLEVLQDNDLCQSIK